MTSKESGLDLADTQKNIKYKRGREDMDFHYGLVIIMFAVELFAAAVIMPIGLRIEERNERNKQREVALAEKRLARAEENRKWNELRDYDFDITFSAGEEETK